MGNFIILIPFFGYVQVYRPFISFLSHLSFFFLFFSFLFLLPSFLFQELFSSFFSFLLARRHLLLSLHRPHLFPLHRHHLFFFSPRSDHCAATTNQHQHQLKLVEWRFGFGGRDLWELGIREFKPWEKKWNRDLRAERCELQGFGWFWAEAEGIERDFRDTVFELLGVNSSSWGRRRTVKAARGRQHGSGARIMS